MSARWSPTSRPPAWPCATGWASPPPSGSGPRFLHSTGQLHKGGPNRGVFVQVVGDAGADVPIPGEDYGFAALEQAQADGDLLTLHERKRRAGRVRIDELLEVS